MDAPAFRLVGLSLEGGWKVDAMIVPPEGATGGNFSCSYAVTHENGQNAFLKALDYSQALKSPDPPKLLQALTTAFLFERDLLRMCNARRMDRIVRSVGSGKVKVDDTAIGTVDYLIFETADRDLRSQLSLMGRIEDAWRLRCLHHVATGLHQLHSADIAHQDLKPSNVLVFDEDISKVADLGCASVKGGTGPRDECACAGDITYAPPELIYGHHDPDWSTRRLGCDAYLLGSMIVFVFAGVSATALITSKLHASHRQNAWQGTYQDVLPYVREAFARGVLDFSTHVVEVNLRKELATMVSYLCEPDPILRGHPLNRTGHVQRLSLERFVSRLNLLAERAELAIRRG